MNKIVSIFVLVLNFCCLKATADIATAKLQNFASGDKTFYIVCGKGTWQRETLKKGDTRTFKLEGCPSKNLSLGMVAAGHPPLTCQIGQGKQFQIVNKEEKCLTQPAACDQAIDIQDLSGKSTCREEGANNSVTTGGVGTNP